MWPCTGTLKRSSDRGKSREGARELDWLDLHLAPRGACANLGGTNICISAHLLGADLLALLRMGALCAKRTQNIGAAQRRRPPMIARQRSRRTMLLLGVKGLKQPKIERLPRPSRSRSGPRR